MSRKLISILVAGIGIVAMNTIAMSSASAVVFALSNLACVEGKNIALCYELKGTEFCDREQVWKICELEGEQSETVEGGKVVFTVLTSPVQKIECQKSSGSGTISQTEPLTEGAKTTLKGKVAYKECKLITEPMKKCVVNTSNETKELLGTLETQKELKLVPNTGTVFIEITYSNNGTETCPATFKGTHAVTGSQSVEITNPGTAEKTKSGKAIGETLEFFSVKAELSQELTMSFTGLEHEVYISTVA